jgi:hypothetical protein
MGISKPARALARDGLAVFDLLWAARDDIPLKPSFNNGQNENGSPSFAMKGTCE